MPAFAEQCCLVCCCRGEDTGSSQVDAEIQELEQQAASRPAKYGDDDMCQLPVGVATWCSLPVDGDTYVDPGVTCAFQQGDKQITKTCHNGEWLQESKETEIAKAMRAKRSHVQLCSPYRWWRYIRCTGVNHPPYFTRCAPSTTTFYAPSGTTGIRLYWQEPTAFDYEDGIMQLKRVKTAYISGTTYLGFRWWSISRFLYSYYPHYGDYFTGSKSGTVYPIVYAVTDRNGVCVFCRFTITVIQTHCSTPRRPTFGSISCPSGTKAGDVCYISCQAGYTTSVSRTTCLSSGAWSADPPSSCTPNTCTSILLTFPNGRYVCPSYNYGQCCYPVCNPGYTLTKNYPITCTSSGWYRIALPTCEDKQAPILYNCPSSVSVTANALETTALVTWVPPIASDNIDSSSYIVIKRYGAIAPNSRIAAGTYRVEYQAFDTKGNPSAICAFYVTVTVIQCPVLSPGLHVSYSCSHGTTYGSECTWRCSRGYELQGSQTTTCGSTGQWSNAAPTCTAITCATPVQQGHTFAHGSYSCPATIYYQSVCVSTCDPGFGQDSISVAVCNVTATGQAVYKINPTPICKDKTPPVIVGCTGIQTVQFTAERSSTSAIATWNVPVATDNLDPSPVVTQLSGPSSGSVVSEDDNVFVEWQATDSSGNPSAKCIWQIVVNVIKCPVYVPPSNAEVSCNHDNIYGSVCSLTCNTGYEVSGPTTTECLQSQAWSTQLTCTVRTCSGPPAPFNHGSFQCADTTYQYNSVCQPSCSTGFALESGTVAVCKGDNWDISVSTVCKDIQPPVIIGCLGLVNVTADIRTDSAVVQVTPPTATDNVDQSPVVTRISGPSNGARVNGTVILRYQAVDAAGNPSDICTTLLTVWVIECPEIPWPSYGVHTCSHSRLYGSSCTYSCDPGYQVSYQDTVTCESDGTWAFVGGVAPVCQAVDCGQPMTVSNGRFSCVSTNYQSVCNLECVTGFSPGVPCRASCGVNSQWSYSTTPACQDSSPPVISNCKSRQMFHAERGKSSCAVSWQLPKVVDNHDTLVILTQSKGRIFGSQFEVGEHIIEYTARDSAGNQALTNCSIVIVVEEIMCLAPSLSFPNVRLNFGCPSFAWGVPCNVICKNTSSQSFGLSGSTSVTCEANTTDPANIQTFWQIDGDLPPSCYEIADEPVCALNLPKPAHGGISYVNTDTLPVAFPYCDQGYDLATGAITQILCLNTGTWSATPKDCIVLLYSFMAVLPASFRYTGTCSTADLDIIKNAVLGKLAALVGTDYAPPCMATSTCTIDDVTVECSTSSVKRRATDILVTLRMQYNQEMPDVATFLEGDSQLSSLSTGIANAIDGGHFAIDVNGIQLSVEPGSYVRADFSNPVCSSGAVLTSSLTCGETIFISPMYPIIDGGSSKTYVWVDPPHVRWTTFVPTVPQTHAVRACGVTAGCGMGEYLTSGSQCQLCPVGTYSDLDATTSCTACPPGSSTLTTGSKSANNCIELCPVNHYSVSGLKPCTPCPRGFIQLETGQTSCTPCPTGTTTLGTNSSCQAFDLVLGIAQSGVTVYTVISELDSMSVAFWYLADTDSHVNFSLASPLLTVQFRNVESAYVDMGVQVYQGGVPQLALIVPIAAIPAGSNVVITTSTADDLRLSGISVYDHILQASEMDNLRSACTIGLSGALLTTDNIVASPGLILDSTTCVAVDPCLSSPCGAANLCTRSGTGFRCTCFHGASGQICEIPPNHCTNITCLNGGSCSSGTTTFTCQCATGYSGIYCQISPVDGGWGSWSKWGPCSASCGEGVMERSRSCDSPAPSSGGRLCSGDTMQSASCDNQACPDPNPCSSSPCGVDHQCTELTNREFECHCFHGYSGPRCETSPDGCYGAHCLNGGSCVTEAAGGYSCVCGASYTGSYCEYATTFTSLWSDWNACTASCSGGQSTRQRSCIPPLDTDFCRATEEKPCNQAPCTVDHCTSSPCGAHSCVSRADTYMCLCNEGFTGSTCSEMVCNCVNGQCIATATGQQQCTCDTGFTGSLCEVELIVVNGGWSDWSEWSLCSATCGEGQRNRSRTCDNPAPSDGGQPCDGNAIDTETCTTTCSDVCQNTECGADHDCIKEGESFRCHCNHGYSGDLCLTPPNPCLPNPCLNGGVCTVVDGNFTCKCIVGYSGDTCDIEPDDSDWGPWEGWGDCSVSCGGGVKERTRTCDLGTEATPCVGDRSQREACNNENCPQCSKLPERYGISITCTEVGDARSCELRCQDGFRVANGSLFFTTYTCGPNTSYEWDQIVEVPSCAPEQLPTSVSGTTETTVSPPIQCSQEDKVNAAVNSKVADTPCVQKSNCLISTTLKGCGTGRRRRSADDSSTISITITLNLTTTDGTNTSAFLAEMNDDVVDTFDTLVSDPDLSIDGVTYAVDMSNVTVEGVVECPVGTMETEDSSCVPCAAGSYYDANQGFCIYCPMGSYQELTGQTQCVNCEPGYYTNNTGSWLSSDCIEAPPRPDESSDNLPVLALSLGIVGGVIAVVAGVGVAYWIRKRYLQRRVSLAKGEGKLNGRTKFYNDRHPTSLSSYMHREVSASYIDVEGFDKGLDTSPRKSI